MEAALSELSKARWTPLPDEPREGRLAFAADFFEPEKLKTVLAGLSERLERPVFGVSIWDSDALWLQRATPGSAVVELKWPARSRGDEVRHFRVREKLYVAVRTSALGSGAFELTRAASEPLELIEDREDVGRVFVLPKVRISAAKTNPATGWKTPADVPVPPLEIHARAIANVDGEVRISTRVPDVSVRPQRLVFRIVEHD